MLNLQCRRFQSAQFQGGHQIIVSPIQYLTYSEIWSERWVSARIHSIKFWCGSRWSAEAGDFFSFFTLWYFFHILFNFIGNNELILMNKTQLYLGWYEWGLSCLGRDMRRFVRSQWPFTTKILISHSLKVQFVRKVNFCKSFPIHQKLTLWDCRTGWPPSQVSLFDELGMRLKNPLFL